MYNTVAGIRIGDDFGISAAQRIADKTTIDLTVQPGTFAGRQLAMLMVKQHSSLLTKRLNFFLGGGLYARNIETIVNDASVFNKTAGVGFTLGGELTLGNLSIAADYVPLVYFGGNDSHRRFTTTSGLSLRYVFVHRPTKTKTFFQKLFKKKK